MWFSTIVLKNVARRPLRSVLTIVAIAIAVGAVVALVGIAAGFEASFLDLYRGVGIDLVVVRGGASQGLNSTIDQEVGEAIRAIPAVADVIPALVDVVSFEDQGLYGVVVQGWVPETPVWSHLEPTGGRLLRAGDTKAVVLGAILAENLAKAVGDTVEVYDEPFRVVGVFRSFSVFEDGSIITALPELQRLLGRKDQVTAFSVQMRSDAKDDASIDRVRRKVEQAHPGLKAMPTREHVESLSQIKVARAMAWLTSSVALVIGAFGMMNTMIMSVHERTREIGILRSIGWRRARVVRMILMESVLLSLVGALVGSLGACLLVRALTRVPMVSGMVSGRIDPIYIGYGFGIALVVGLLGGLLPAFRAARMPPTAALRYE